MKWNFSGRQLQNKKTVLGIPTTVGMLHWKKPEVLNITVTKMASSIYTGNQNIY